MAVKNTVNLRKYNLDKGPALTDKPLLEKSILFMKLEKLFEQEDLASIKTSIKRMQNNYAFNDKHYNAQVLIENFGKISNSRTLERAKYYIRQTIKSIKETKTGKWNDINLNQWKGYTDILTDSLWVLPRRDNSSVHKGDYWGNFIPQIPNQLIRRFTKKGEWILDPFLGSGTTLIECRKLGRNGIGVELQDEIAVRTTERINSAENEDNVKTDVYTGDSANYNISTALKKSGAKSVQMVVLHPPYWDIIQFSKDSRDLSNAASLQGFLSGLGKVVDNCAPHLDEGRYLSLVIGDKYSNSSWVPLGFYAMQEVQKRGFSLKSIVVKNFDETKGKMNQQELWRYRALVGGFYIFKHEYIFLFTKDKK